MGEIADTESLTRIAVLQGATNRAIQAAMWRFANRLSEGGAGVVGLIEVFEHEAGSGRHEAVLQSLRGGARYPIFQDLGPMATACHLDGSGIVAACASVCEQIERGCDVVVLSKFGQLEARRSGLTDAFAAAVSHGVPILTAVSPAYMAAWTAFSSSLGLILPPQDEALEAWWRAASSASKRAKGPTGTKAPSA